MSHPDQGNKGQTTIGYSHGTGVSIGGPATAVTGKLFGRLGDPPVLPESCSRGHGDTAAPPGVTRGVTGHPSIPTELLPGPVGVRSSEG